MSPSPSPSQSPSPGPTTGANTGACPRPGQRLLWVCVAASLLLGIGRGAVWEHRHDEGTTFDLAIGKVVVGEFIERWPAQPVPLSTLLESVEARSSYSLGDAIDSVGLPFRLFHPPGYYGLLHVWTKVFGTSRVVMRVPAYVLAALAVLGMAWIARRVIPELHSGVWAAALFAVSPWILSITNFARPYHLAVFCAVWSTLAVLAMYGDGPRGRWRVVFVGLSLLGVYSLYHYAFVLAWQLALAVGLAWWKDPARRRRELGALAGCLAVIVAGFAPWLRVFRVHANASAKSGDYFTGAVEAAWWPMKSVRALRDFALADSMETFGGPQLAMAVTVLGILTLPLIVWAFAGRPRKALDLQARLFWISAPVMPLLIILSDVWRGSHSIFVTKLCFGFIILLALAVVRAWLCVPFRAVRIAGLTAWVAILGLASVFCTYTRAVTPSGQESAAALISQADSEKHLVVVSTDLRGYSVPFLLSLRDAGVRDVFVTTARGQQLVNLLTTVDGKQEFERVSLVNMLVPHNKNVFMWDDESLKQAVLRMRAAEWQVFWDKRQPWMTGDAYVGKRVPTTARELWMLGPVRARFFHGTI